MSDLNYLEKMSSSLGPRFYTLKVALSVFRHAHGRSIVQSGCLPLPGAHDNTYLVKIICKTLKKNKNIKYHIFDEDIKYDTYNSSVSLAQSVIRDTLRNDQYDRGFVYKTEDNTQSLKDFKDRVDLLILNENNYPIKELIKKTKIKENYLRALEILNGFEEKDLRRYDDIINPSQERQLEQYMSVRRNLHHNSIVLLEGADLPGGGQTRLAAKQLAKDGFICLLDSKQSVWIKR